MRCVVGGRSSEGMGMSARGRKRFVVRWVVVIRGSFSQVLMVFRAVP